VAERTVAAAHGPNKGALLFRAAIAKAGESASQAAARLKASEGAVSRWLRGERAPVYAWRKRLLELYGVPDGAWDLPAPGRRKARGA
jgi:transcriptional regulator with XRE-family HTH domain